MLLPFDPTIIVALITAIGALAGVFIMRFKPAKNTHDEEQDKKITDMNLILARMEEREKIKDRRDELELIAAIHKATTPHLDALLEKVKNDIMNETDIVTLAELTEAKHRIQTIIQELRDSDQVESTEYVAYAKMEAFVEVRVLRKQWND